MTSNYDTNVFSVCANTSAAAFMDRSLPLLGMRCCFKGVAAICTGLEATEISPGVFRVEASFERPNEELAVEQEMRWSR